jgi:integrase
MALTDVACRKAQPKEKPYKLADSAGLFLLVTPAGGKYWRLKYRIAGKEKLLALGVYPETTLTEARDKRNGARKLIANGTDPSHEKKVAKRVAELKGDNTFERIARAWIDLQRGKLSKSTADKILAALVTHAFPKIGHRPIADISPAEFLEMLRKIESQGALETARRVSQWCGRVFRYAIISGLASYNPAADMRGALKTAKVEHLAALSAADLPDFLKKLDDPLIRLNPLTRLALHLLLLTFVRPGELRAAEWAEFDTEKAEWRIPAQRMKMKAPHLVPLSRQALAILEQLKPISGHSHLLFPAVTDPQKCLSDNTMTQAIRRRLGFDATAHGMRATASTILNEQGWRPDVIERQLAHKEQNEVRAAYHRSEYLEDRRRMMQGWADYLDGVQAGAKIIPLKGKTA